MERVWQHPFVNVFKHVKIDEWKRSSKEGDVSTIMDKILKGTVFRIRGSIPASNYIQLPKTSMQSLGLTGRYLYILFRPIPGKHFVVHLDVTTEDSQVIRISFSNLFKEFKSTATWLQFPFLCGAVKGSVYDSTAQTARQDLVGPAPTGVRWTCLLFDLQYVLSVYLNRRYSHLKSVKLCSSLLVKNLVTSDLLFEPGVTFSEARLSNLVSHGASPMPREVAFPVGKDENWHDKYDFIRFPSDGSKMPFDSIQKGQSSHSDLGRQRMQIPARVMPRCVNISKPVQDRVSLIQQITTPKTRPRRTPLLTKTIPKISLTSSGHSNTACIDRGMDDDEAPEACHNVPARVKAGDDGVHVHTHPDGGVTIHRHSISSDEVPHTKEIKLVSLSGKKLLMKTRLLPDPILKLSKIIGFGGYTTRWALWNKLGTSVVYPCHAIIVAMQIDTGEQTFFLGHTDKVSALAFNGNCTLLASAQTGNLSMVRLWNFLKGSCLSMFKSHVHSVSSLSFSHSGAVLCSVGKDGHGKNMVVVWNTAQASCGGDVVVLAKAHTDVDIRTMKIAFFDDTRMVSCGHDNIRLWRVRSGTLRSCPVNLGEYHILKFTDLAFEEGYSPEKEPEERTLFVCSSSGHILEIDYKNVAIRNVRRILTSERSHCHRREKQTFLSEHEGPVSSVNISPDGLKVLSTTAMGNLGYLDIPSRAFSTMMRSHTDSILAFSLDGIRKKLITVSKDNTLRIWDLGSLQQQYDFTSVDETPCSVTFHPLRQVFACGFGSGIVRVFNVSSSSLLVEHKQHRGAITGLLFSPEGNLMYSSCSQGSLALYNSADQHYHVVRVLGNVVSKDDNLGPEALVISSDAQLLAFVGPSEYTVTVMDARTLDELLRVDVSILDLESTSLDSALSLRFTPTPLNHLLVSTSANKVLWLDSKSGRLIREVSQVHKTFCSSLAVSHDSRFLLTSGDRVIKIWDYQMKKDINSQVYIGHSELVQQVKFAPDQKHVISVGDAVFMWTLLATSEEIAPEADIHQSHESLKLLPEDDANKVQRRDSTYIANGMPRRSAPVPCISSPPILDISSIHQEGRHDTFCESDEGEKLADIGTKELVNKDHSVLINKYEVSRKKLPLIERPKSSPVQRGPENDVPGGVDSVEEQYTCPDAYRHFIARFKTSPLPKSFSSPPCGQESLSLKTVIGYNGNGRGNMVWNPDTGFFAYTCGCVVVVEDLHSGSQKHWFGHPEEISTLAVANEDQVLASASGLGSGASRCQIRLWNVSDGSCRKILYHHKTEVQAMAFSRDDRFLVTVGDYRDRTLALWDTNNFELLLSNKFVEPIQEVAFNPMSADQFASVGTGAVTFWLMEQRGVEIKLKSHMSPIPDEVSPAELTSLTYNTNSLLYCGTNTGRVCVWDTENHSCFMTWEADEGEIGVLLCTGNRLITGSNTKRIRLWAVAAVQELRLKGSKSRSSSVFLEYEMTLDGTLVSASFDDSMDMGIVGTTAGTLWYINWVENNSIRLISGHRNKVNDVAFSPAESLCATCGEDGSVRVWSLASMELVVQFQVLNQSCLCLAWSPVYLSTSGPENQRIVAGYSDGTIRVFSVSRTEMELKIHPHPCPVTAITYSVDGEIILSGGKDGLVAVSSPRTGMTVRVLSDHKGFPITVIQSMRKKHDDFDVEGQELWLAASLDRRASVWVADWLNDKCEIIDWLTFPAPVALEKPGSLPPSLAAFSPWEKGTLVYVGFGAEKEVLFYSLHNKQVLKKIPISHFVTSLSLSSASPLLVVGSNERILRVIDCTSGLEQDYLGYDDCIHLCKVAPSGKLLFTAAYNEVLIWEIRSR
ncbi:WD repeat-containing protein 90 isoform X3 [Pleurodeles waltl]|uniref:WD repeat-containing protein 90 isoform X3 n=1 Tax=Pleurodeles waltl TaxID=8319 RepID=UPI003709495C